MASEDFKEKPINPRTHLPYVRGGAYDKRKSKSAAVVLTKTVKAAHSGDTNYASVAASCKAETVELKAKITLLEAKVSAQADTIKRVESTMASECQHAELRAVKSSALELRQSYKDSLRDGASLSSGTKE